MRPAVCRCYSNRDGTTTTLFLRSVWEKKFSADVAASHRWNDVNVLRRLADAYRCFLRAPEKKKKNKREIRETSDRIRRRRNTNNNEGSVRKTKKTMTMHHSRLSVDWRPFVGDNNNSFRGD
jgi:hypothetical protein